MTRMHAHQLRFRYPAQNNWAVAGVDLEIAAGQITWLTGALGSGTSTMLLTFAGLAPRLTGGERQGRLHFDDHDPATLHPLAAGIAYLGPSPALQLSGIARSVRDEIAVGPMNLGWSRERIHHAVQAAMVRLHIDHLAERAPGELSGGETQRVLLAAMAVVAPKVWLLDEPFSSLDYPGRILVADLLGQMAREGAMVVVACDDADMMATIAGRLVVFAGGEVVLDGVPSELLAGDDMLQAGAGTTDAATLAIIAGWSSPRPLDTEALLGMVRKRVPVSVSETTRELSPAALESGTPATLPILALEGVGFGYPGGPPVFGGVSFEIRPGEAVGLFGPNGAGKSTLLRLAMALEQPTSGSIRTLGHVTTGRYPEHFAPRAGFLFQQPERQLFATSVRGECAVALQLAGWSTERIEAAVAKILDELGLDDVAAKHPYDLPLPRRRLVALASILVAGPELVLLDEPTAGLDATSRERVIDVIRTRVAGGLAALVITHDAIFAHETLARAIHLFEGHMVDDGPVRGVLDGSRLPQPAALAVALELGIPAGHDRCTNVAAVLARLVGRSTA